MLAAAVRDAGAEAAATVMATTTSRVHRAARPVRSRVGLIITSGGVAPGPTRSSRTPSAEPVTRGWSSSRWPCSLACRKAPAGSPARRSSRCPATPSAPWCRSRCSSVPRCAPRWACRSAPGRGHGRGSPKHWPHRPVSAVSPRGFRRGRRHCRHPRPAGSHHCGGWHWRIAYWTSLPKLPNSGPALRSRSGPRRETVRMARVSDSHDTAAGCGPALPHRRPRRGTHG